VADSPHGANPFRHLGPDAEDNYRVLQRELCDPQDLETAVSELLRDPFVAEDLMSKITGVYSYGTETLGDGASDEDRIVGATGFIGFANAMEIAARTGNPREEPNPSPHLLEVAAVDAFFRSWYRLPRSDPAAGTDLAPVDTDRLIAISLASATPYRVGTTSFILKNVQVEVKGETRNEIYGDTVLKCLRPRFATFGTIEEVTRNYRDEQPSKTFTPTIYASGTRYISMAWIDGTTLDDELVKIIESPTDGSPLSARRRELLRNVVGALATRLPQLEKPHFDLSPWNIMIKTDDGAVRLIDFGKNFILQGGYSSPKSAGRAQRFIAPELTRRDVDESWADVYSLGQIILDVLMRSDEEPRADPRDGLDALWRDVPGLAALVEDLIEEAPSLRAVMTARPALQAVAPLTIPHPTLAEIYAHVARTLERENQFYTDAMQTDERRVFRFNPFQVSRFTPEQFGRIGSIVKRYKQSKDPDVQNARWLLRAAQVALGLGGLLCFVMFLETMIDVGASGWSAIASHNPLFPTGHPYILSHLEMRAIPVSVGLVAVMYYLSIFSPISTAGLRGLWPKGLGLTMRTSSWAPVLIQFVGLVFPKWWGLLAIAGGLLIGINNAVAVEFASRAEGASPFSGKVLDANFVRIFRWWAPSLILYSGSVAVVWALWRWGLGRNYHVHDLAVYAVIIVIANLGKMYFQNCRSDGATFRANLGRAVAEERRRAALDVRLGIVAGSRVVG
jgi:hypothetical protein